MVSAKYSLYFHLQLDMPDLDSNTCCLILFIIIMQLLRICKVVPYFNRYFFHGRAKLQAARPSGLGFRQAISYKKVRLHDLFDGIIESVLYLHPEKLYGFGNQDFE